ncbi:MAG: hypothetical protein ABJE66_16395 [Deltaproteobacteria bacterium]
MLRGVMADAECPRCGMTSPPPEAGLVTCKQCALVYPPHEVQHKSSRSVEPDYPAPPPNVDAFIESDVVVVRWPLARYIGVLLIAVAGLLAVPAHELVRWYSRGPFVVMIVGCVYFAVVQLFGSHQLAIAADGVTHHVPFALVPSVRIPTTGLRAVAMVPTQLGGELHVRSKSRRARTRIARGTDRVALRYAAQLIGAKLALPLED